LDFLEPQKTEKNSNQYNSFIFSDVVRRN